MHDTTKHIWADYICARDKIKYISLYSNIPLRKQRALFSSLVHSNNNAIILCIFNNMLPRLLPHVASASLISTVLTLICSTQCASLSYFFLCTGTVIPNQCIHAVIGHHSAKLTCEQMFLHAILQTDLCIEYLCIFPENCNL